MHDLWLSFQGENGRTSTTAASAALSLGHQRNDDGRGGNPGLMGCADERQRVRRQLEDYCVRDTEGMVWIFEALRETVP